MSLLLQGRSSVRAWVFPPGKTDAALGGAFGRRAGPLGMAAVVPMKLGGPYKKLEGRQQGLEPCKQERGYSNEKPMPLPSAIRLLKQ